MEEDSGPEGLSGLLDDLRHLVISNWRAGEMDFITPSAKYSNLKILRKRIKQVY